jgi:hypothetical protein
LLLIGQINYQLKDMVAEFILQQFFQDNEDPVFGDLVYQIKYASDNRVFSGQRIRCRHFFTPDKIQLKVEFYFPNFLMSFSFF